MLPHDTNNFAAEKNYSRFALELRYRNKVSNVLVIGAGDGNGTGIKALASHPGIKVISSDIAPRAEGIICVDAHSIPFPDESFDGIVAQAVLEHVLDPHQCVKEIYRVLKPSGLVYAETPFMQQVHGAEYDFTRFTHLGHRRLFRFFREIDSGIAVGPGSTLAWAWEYFWLTFTKKRGTARRIVRGLCRLSTFWAPLLDPWLSKKIGAYDSASGFYFIGEKSDHPIPDCELLKQFRGVR